MSRPDHRILAMLERLHQFGGVCGASDYPDDLLRPWYDDRGRETDTFNLASDAGLILVSHDSDSDSSTARITDKGRRAIHEEPPR